MQHYSPLRYPGGKSFLAPVLINAIYASKRKDCIFIEPFAGGGGASLTLLANEHVSRIILNDLDPHIYSFWKSLLENTTKFIDLLESTYITIDEWKKQREIYLNYKRYSTLKIGFSAFFLNRCNRSGILGGAGPIGGIEQIGKWKLNARYNKDTLRERLLFVASFKDRITVTNYDAIDLINKEIKGLLTDNNSAFIFLDPPYYHKGPKLYLNAYTHEDHVKLAKTLERCIEHPWMLTYDDSNEIASLYSNHNIQSYNLSYTAHSRKTGVEFLICSPNMDGVKIN